MENKYKDYLESKRIDAIKRLNRIIEDHQIRLDDGNQDIINSYIELLAEIDRISNHYETGLYKIIGAI